jgi:peptidyl-prolyl cis-trans isomerase C|nr:peptidyl-prolyl cis-trans isomerase [Candidatus Krumholzibacteria bacterium]
MYPCKLYRTPAARPAAGLVFLILILTFLLAGCGGGDKSGTSGDRDAVVLATVGEVEVTDLDYERGLVKLEPNELPVDDQGQFLDMAGREGKKEFLEVLINKELLNLKARQLGYDQEPDAVNARKSLLAYHAQEALWKQVVGEPANTITEEELQAFYANMGKTRNCQFVICNFIEDAHAAKKHAEGGADWDEMVDKFHDGSEDPAGKYEIAVPYGQYSSSFEDRVYEIPIGGITEPIKTSYGYWVLRVMNEKQGKKPDLEAAKAQVLDITRNRKMGRARNDFQESVIAKHQLTFDEDVLWICYQGIPEGDIMDPATNQPRNREDLEPLNVPAADLDRFFFSYYLGGELKEFTLGDYKEHFDKMGVFQRPKRGDMLGGLRQKITNEVGKGFMEEEARERGLEEDPEVVAKVDTKVEEIMVTRLYGDLVTFDERVTIPQMDEYYAQYPEKFLEPEVREGRLVVCLNPKQAGQARDKARTGAPWREILKEFGNDKGNIAQGGKITKVIVGEPTPLEVVLFAMQEGEVSDPFPMENGRHGVVMLESVTPERMPAREGLNEKIAFRIKNERREKAFKDLLAQWSEEFGVTRFEENLDGLPSYEELKTVQQPENLVPVN